MKFQFSLKCWVSCLNFYFPLKFTAYISISRFKFKSSEKTSNECVLSLNLCNGLSFVNFIKFFWEFFSLSCNKFDYFFLLLCFVIKIVSIISIMSSNFGKIILWKWTYLPNFLLISLQIYKKKSQLKEYRCKSQNRPETKLL